MPRVPIVMSRPSSCVPNQFAAPPRNWKIGVPGAPKATWFGCECTTGGAIKCCCCEYFIFPNFFYCEQAHLKSKGNAPHYAGLLLATLQGWRVSLWKLNGWGDGTSPSPPLPHPS